MTKGVKVRLVAFLILSAVGIVYVAGSYLGLVDKVLGRGFTVHATLPGSGGLFEGSEVTYRGVKIGEVTKMRVTDTGLKLSLALQEGTKLPVDSPMYVHNLSAVGEQYLDFEPLDRAGPYVDQGDTLKGDADSLPLGEDVLLQDLSALIKSVDKAELNTVVTELGTMFRGNATPLRSLVDDAQAFIAAAQANQEETISLLDNAEPVLETQADNSENIQAFARDLALLTETLKNSDGDVRTVLREAPSTFTEVRLLTEGLREVLPAFLRPVTSLTVMLSDRRPALEQLLVTFPRLISAGPSALEGDKQKFGRVNLNLNQEPPPCTEGYLPPEQRRPPWETSFVQYFPANCASGPPINMRGMKYAPAPLNNGKVAR